MNNKQSEFDLKCYEKINLKKIEHVQLKKEVDYALFKYWGTEKSPFIYNISEIFSLGDPYSVLRK